MKTIKLAFLALIALAGITGSALAQSEETRSVSGFNGISSGGSFAVHVKIDGTESLKIQGDKQDISEIETVVEHGILEIKTPHDWGHFHQRGKVDIYITAKSLSSLSLGGSGSIDVSGTVKGDNVSVSMGGSGSISADVEADNLKASVAGSGKLQIQGKAAKAKVEISGSGKISGEQLKIDAVEISIAGSGSCHLDVEKTMSAHIAGSGSVYYTGNAVTTNVTTAGSGRVTKVK
ncbi:head GIN domain-containing protein [Puia dinghuensis]|uniref:DUF2807 domain-containing protein n=1 Tax=Puia dinghuensis TaxID=1792502 RepID=A0A8J2UE84_9BACT|nr:head GIN domain-containing protein [Puia dinghuensis]GGB04207.1 DUF2807 domain-containing protein [Puia dinghuensis]